MRWATFLACATFGEMAVIALPQTLYQTHLLKAQALRVAHRTHAWIADRHSSHACFKTTSTTRTMRA